MKKHDFLKTVVRLCLIMMVIITTSAITASFVTGIPLDSAALGVLMGGWCGELLLTLLRRMFDKEDKAEEKETTCAGCANLTYSNDGTVDCMYSHVCPKSGFKYREEKKDENSNDFTADGKLNG